MESNFAVYLEAPVHPLRSIYLRHLSLSPKVQVTDSPFSLRWSAALKPARERAARSKDASGEATGAADAADDECEGVIGGGPLGGVGRRGSRAVEAGNSEKQPSVDRQRLTVGQDGPVPQGLRPLQAPSWPWPYIFIYRGEIAFCSLECRQNHIMNLDELKEKCSLTSLKTDAPQATAGSEASTNGETAAAA